MKAVIPSAGLGTRLLPATKEIPKEMLPLFSEGVLKPLLQIIYEELYRVGIREFCIITGRTKRAVEDHFTPDENFLYGLNLRTKHGGDLKEFYQKLEDSRIMWVNQPKPKGLGDAVMMAESFTGSEPFLVHAGDTYIYPRGVDAIKSLIKASQEFQADVVFLMTEVKDPKRYGVPNLTGEKNGVYEVIGVEEKPKRPRSNLAIVPIYVFKPIIYRALEQIDIGKGGETQLTDAIQRLIEWKKKVYAIELGKQRYVDIGKPETYLEAIRLSSEA